MFKAMTLSDDIDDVSNTEHLFRIEEWQKEHEHEQRSRDAEHALGILSLVSEAKADREIAHHRHTSVISMLKTLTDWTSRHEFQHSGETAHRQRLDSIHEDRDTALDVKASAALSKADLAWSLAGKGSALAFAGGGIVTLIKYLFF